MPGLYNPISNSDLIHVLDTANNFTATTVEGALAESAAKISSNTSAIVAIAEVNADAEMVAARDGKPTLGARLDEIEDDASASISKGVTANLINPDAVIFGGYARILEGSLDIATGQANYCCSEYIDIGDATSVYYGFRTGYVGSIYEMLYFDSNHTYISKESSAVGASGVRALPASTRYVILDFLFASGWSESLYKAQIGCRCMSTLGIAEYYVPYSEIYTLNNNPYATKISDIVVSKSYENGTTVVETNGVKAITYTSGTGMAGNAYNVTAGQKYYVNMLITLTSGAVTAGKCGIQAYDASATRIVNNGEYYTGIALTENVTKCVGFVYTAGTGVVIIIPSFISMSVGVTATMEMRLYDVTGLSDTEIAGIDWMNIDDRNVMRAGIADHVPSKWAGKKLCAYGDSITASYYWLGYVTAALGFGTMYRRGIGSSSISWNTSTWYANMDGSYNSRGATPPAGTEGVDFTTHVSSSFCDIDRIDTMIPDDADLIFVMGGTNDHQLNVAIGDLTYTGTNLDHFDSTVVGYDESTFKGALASMIRKIQSKYLNAFLVLGTPYSARITTAGVNQADPVKNTLNLTTEDYAKAVIDVGHFLSVPVIDVFGKTGINTFNAVTYLATSDTMHPNVAGDRRIASVIINGLKSAELMA